ncbi:hypothetical protein CYR32_01020 [Chimaeribacter coloradensis]|uniref:Uncharacterized protein n=1 Tax=Chimaeribacter coloradensis TaxID=2060068 RepID=A0A2N5ECW4_9GAMM|nr:hypothetical protein [Chimaeribacter coloradensis]PLR40352.1 hypothetical protein CYR32_01020 [Chimaeribacter coloradensis]
MLNIKALSHIYHNLPELIEETAGQSGTNLASARGVARQIMAEKTLANLSPAQMKVFDQALRPLIENAQWGGDWRQDE